MINQYRFWRTKNNLTQEAVAKYLGLAHRSAVCKWETNQSHPRIELLPKLAALYNCTVDDFLDTQPTT